MLTDDEARDLRGNLTSQTTLTVPRTPGAPHVAPLVLMLVLVGAPVLAGTDISTMRQLVGYSTVGVPNHHWLARQRWNQDAEFDTFS